MAAKPGSETRSRMNVVLHVVQFAAIAFLVYQQSNNVTPQSPQLSSDRARRSDDLSTLTFEELAAEVQALKLAVQKGVPGPPGPPGPRGFDGIDGKDGERGPRGYKGTTGDVGPRGPGGRDGIKGSDGANGYCAVYDEDGELSMPCPELRDAANAEELDRIRSMVEELTMQTIVAEMSKEQRVRYEGASGLTQTRGYQGGDKAYHEASYTNIGFANFHNHANLMQTMGMGEVAVVLNGVEFWTRHNDYSLMEVNRNLKPEDQQLYQTTYIPQPDVPPSVLKFQEECSAIGVEACVDKQSEEMRRWFHAWQDQDPRCPSCVKLDDERVQNNLTRWDGDPITVNGVRVLPFSKERYYPKYFQPVLSAVEGYWKKGDLKESFHSDRHFTDASDFRELYDKNRFLLQSGRKATQENLPFLPLSVRGLKDEITGENATAPSLANWDYRIICVPIEEDVPLHNFRVASDLAIQLGTANLPQTLEDMEQTRRARFDLNARNQSTWVEGRYAAGLIDNLMYKLPGLDGYNGNLYDDSFGANATVCLPYGKSRTGNDPCTVQTLNTAFYSRYYEIGANDAMGRSSHRRGFNDPSLWAAMTTQPSVHGVTSCTNEGTDGRVAPCEAENVKTQKWTWAVPLEIIFMTPLTKWNPYNLTFCSANNADSDACGYTMEGPIKTPVRRMNGNCNMRAYMHAVSKSECEDQAAQLNLADVTATTQTDGTRPRGCYFHPAANRLYFNNGGQDLTDNTYHSLCWNNKTRTGSPFNASLAYNGLAKDTWFTTPNSFYAGDTEKDVDPADTSSEVVGALDPSGNLRKVIASGHWLHFPRIKGFKKSIRQRYPIMPVHEHGRNTWKEIKALQDILIDAGGSSALRAGFDQLREERIGVNLRVQYTGGAGGTGPHSHTVHISGDKLKEMDASPDGISVATSSDNGHSHEIRVNRQKITMRTGIPVTKYQMLQCDDKVNGAIRMCGKENTTSYEAKRNAIMDRINQEKPWALYTQADKYFINNATHATWKDASGNKRDTVATARIWNRETVPTLQDINTEISGAVFTENDGLVFPSGSIGANFTIIARAKYIDGNDAYDESLRYIVGSNRTNSNSAFYLGWSGSVGVAQFGSRRVHSNSGNSSRAALYDYQTVAGTNGIDKGGLMVNGANVSARSGTDGGYTPDHLLLGGKSGIRGSDFVISDLVIFDKVLSPSLMTELSNIIQNPPQRPRPCCFDLHASVTQIDSSD